MPQVIEKYVYANKYYVKIFDGVTGIVQELSSLSELTDEEWESLYEQTKQQEQQEIILEAEDGTEI